MPNVAAVLRSEIRRLAKKEIKAHFVVTKQSIARYRSAVAKLRMAITQQEREIKQLKQRAEQKAHAKAGEGPLGTMRFSARSVKAQRMRLGLSAANYGKLLGVSGLAVYNWEKGVSRPRQKQFAALVAMRGMGKREAAAALAELRTKKRAKTRR